MFILTVLMASSFTLLAECPDGSADAPRLHLFVLSGQSNMANLDPEASFTPMVTAAFPGDKVVVIKDAQGGQPIRRWHKEWKPLSGSRPWGDGELYQSLMDKVRPVSASDKPDTVTFVWMQGERDAREGHGSVYSDSLRAIVAQLETDLEHPGIFVVLGRLSDHGNDDPDRPDWNLIRDVQVHLAESNPRWDWVDTDDLNDPGNKLHYTPDGYRQLGERFAARSIELIRQSPQEKGQTNPALPDAP